MNAVRFRSLAVFHVVGFMALTFAVSGLNFARQPIPIISSIDWNSDGIRLAIAYLYGPVLVVNTQTGETVFEDVTFTVANALVWHPTEPNILAVGGNADTLSGLVKILDTLSGNVILTLDGDLNIPSVAWSPDGSRIAASSSPMGISPIAQSEVRIWDAITGELQIRAKPLSAEAVVNTISWGPDGAEIAGGTSDSLVIVWSSVTGEVLRTFEHHDVVLSVAWSPDGRYIASSSFDQDDFVRIWNAASGHPVTITTSQFASDLSWNRTGSELVIAENGSVRVFSTSEQETVFVFPTDSLERTVAFSPYGGRIAFGGELLGKARDSITLTDSAIIRYFAEGAVRVVVPFASPNRLRFITELCGASEEVNMGLVDAIDRNDAQDFISQVRSLSSDAIPAACAADLIAVAEVLLQEQPQH